MIETDAPTTAGVPFINSVKNSPFSELDKKAPDVLGNIKTEARAWGLYTAGGSLALEADSVSALEPSRDFRALDYPIEKGDFRSYNKVRLPAETRIILTKGGTEASRKEFLDKLDQLIESMDLFSIVSPEQTFLDRTLLRYDYRRTAENGATLLTVEILTQEIRQTATSKTSNSKNPSGETLSSNGPTLPATPTAAQMPAASLVPSNSLVAAIPRLTGTESLLARAQTVSKLVKAGATLGDMVSKGVKFQAVPLRAIGAQSLSVMLAGQPVKMNIRQKAFGLHIDVLVKDRPLVRGALGRAGVALVRAPTSKFLGDIIFHDTRGTGADPTLSGLGSRFALLFAGA